MLSQAQIEQRRNAARKGGKALVEKKGREYMANLGKRGAARFWEKYTLVPVGANDFAIVSRATGEPTGKTMNGKHLR